MKSESVERDRRARRDVKSWLRECLSNARSGRRNRKRKWQVDITIDDLLDKYEAQQHKCYWTDWDLTTERGPCQISLDRKDNNEGYTKENTVLTCWCVNRVKSDLSVENFVTLCHAVVKKSTPR